MNLLFVCARNRLRSPTAEQVFSAKGYECDSGGLAPDADAQLSSEQVRWADLIFVMERSHRAKLSRLFRGALRGKRVIVLGIPDDHAFMAPALVDLLERKVSPFLR